MDRKELLRILENITKNQFNKLVFILDIPRNELLDEDKPQTERAIDLLSWAESYSGYGLEKIEKVLSEIHNTSYKNDCNNTATSTVNGNHQIILKGLKVKGDAEINKIEQINEESSCTQQEALTNLDIGGNFKVDNVKQTNFRNESKKKDSGYSNQNQVAVENVKVGRDFYIGCLSQSAVSFFGSSSEIQRQRDLKVRQSLLNAIEEDVTKRLQDSLHKLVKIDLETKLNMESVSRQTLERISPDTEDEKNILNREFTSFVNKQEVNISLKPSEKVLKIFYRKDVGKKLLILGEPGCGKTTELLTLALDLVSIAKENPEDPIPIIFELSSWKTNLTFEDWLIGQLFEIYGIKNHKLSKKWIEEKQFIYLLDGLDELGLRNQEKCIKAINTFLRHRQKGVVVCCRIEEYEQGEVKLEKLNGAIFLKRLSDLQVKTYLKKLNCSTLLDSIEEQLKLKELVTIPLFLNILTIAYQGEAINSKEQLLNKYIQTQLKISSNQNTYSHGKTYDGIMTLYYLIWLAQKLEAESRTEFLLEKIQPTWLSLSQQKIYKIMFLLIFGMIGWMIGWLNKSIIVSLILGVTGMLSGRVSGNMPIIPAEKLNFSWKNFFLFWFSGSFFGWYLGGVIGGLALGLSGGLGLGFNYSEFERKVEPNQGLWLSLKNLLIFALIFGLIFGLIFALISGLNLGWMFTSSFAVMLGLIIGLMLLLIGGVIGEYNIVFKHFIIRLILWTNGYIPWNYARFLDYAVKHRLMQQVGGRYRFTHDLLKQHFADMPLSKIELKKFLNI